LKKVFNYTTTFEFTPPPYF